MAVEVLKITGNIAYESGFMNSRENVRRSEVINTVFKNMGSETRF